MDREQQERYDALMAELDTLERCENPTPAQEMRLAEVYTESLTLRDQVERSAAGRALVDRVRSGQLRTEGGASGDYDRDPLREPGSVEDYRSRTGSNPWDLSNVRTFGRDRGDVANELRARALSAVERMPGATDRVRSVATDMIERFDDGSGTLARQALITSSPAYLRAWSKLAGSRQATLTAEENLAVQEAGELARAMNTGDTAGGYLVPFQLDPTVILTSDGSRNDIRQFARQVVATGNVWHGVAADAVSWSWDGEAEEVSDDSPTLAQPEIEVHKAQGFVPISIEAIEDAQNVTAEVAKLLAAGKDDLEAEAFVTGSGTGRPTGIVTALAGTSAVTTPATPETFALADVHALRSSLPARYRQVAAWLANDLIYSRIRQFDVSGGGGLWEYMREDRPDRLLGKPVGEAEAMDASWNAAVTANNYVAVFGDFSNYVIADRIGMTVEFIPHLFGANRRPTGQRGWYAYTRMGADVVNARAFKMLNVATTA